MPHNAFPPGPKPRFLIGNMPLAGADPLARFEAWAREYGDIFHYRAAWLPVYFLNHPDYIERVLVTQQQDFLKDRVIQNSRWFLGQGLLTNEGSSWLRQRRLSRTLWSCPFRGSIPTCHSGCDGSIKWRPMRLQVMWG